MSLRNTVIFMFISHNHLILSNNVCLQVKANIPTRPAASRLLAKRLARQLLGRTDRDSPQLEVIEPPVEYMQEDLTHLDPNVPTEFVFMLRNIR